MILAAGRGSRLRPLTDFVPKPLLHVGGESLAGRHLCRLARAGVRRVVINTAWLGERVRVHLGDGGRFGTQIVYSNEGEQALETGGGILRALGLLESDEFLLVNGDVWTDLDFAAVPVPAPDDLATIVLVDNPPHHPGGDFGLDGDRVTPATGGRSDALTYAGIAILRPELFAGSGPGVFPLAPLLNAAVRAGRLRGHYHEGAWFDTGSAEGLRRARRYAAAASR